MGRSHNLEAIVECARRLAAPGGHPFSARRLRGEKSLADPDGRRVKLSNVTIADRVAARGSARPVDGGGRGADFVRFKGMAGVSVPSRLYNVLAAGKPIIAIAEAHSELAQVIEEEQVGWVVSPDDLSGFEAAVLEAAANPTPENKWAGGPGGRRNRRINTTAFSMPTFKSWKTPRDQPQSDFQPAIHSRSA